VKDILWLKPDGTEMTDEEWDQHFARCLGVYLSGVGLPETDARGGRSSTTISSSCSTRTTSRSTSVCRHRRGVWESVIDTSTESGGRLDGWHSAPERPYPLQGRTLALLVQRRGVSGAA